MTRRDTSPTRVETRALLTVLLFAFHVTFAGALSAQKQQYKRTDSRAPYVHHITLLAADGHEIDPADPLAPPYSPRRTCEKCHDYELISGGFHFDHGGALEGGGEPFVFYHPRSGSVLPLSYRDDPGAYSPASVGLDPLAFILEFGSHLPGGTATHLKTGVSRSAVTGDFEVDCMLCHAADRAYSTKLRAEQLKGQNFAWAPGVATGLAHVEGSVKGLDDDFDAAAEGARERLPKVRYDQSRFDGEGLVHFDLRRSPANEACYSCHSTRSAGAGVVPRFLSDEDVHLEAGLSCVDCHKSGLDHQFIRGREGEAASGGGDKEAISVTSLSCRGCHMGVDQEGGRIADAGRFGAPKPLHLGLPVVHFERMSCTACHSGPLPGMEAQQVQTARAHRLGLPSQTRNDQDLPLIVETLFTEIDGVIAPQRAFWPSGWAWRDAEGTLELIDPEVAYKVIRKSMRVRGDFAKEVAGDAGGFAEKISKGLAAFAKDAESGKDPVYFSSGRLYRLDGAGTLLDEVDRVDRRYSWPIAHDVRPARQALGSGGCTDCHAAGSPMFYGQVTARGIAPAEHPPAIEMTDLIGLDAGTRDLWTLLFAGRPYFKLLISISIFLTTLALLFNFTSATGQETQQHTRLSATERLAYSSLLLAIALGAITSGFSLYTPSTLAGTWLVAHMLAAGLFALAAAALAILWARTSGPCYRRYGRLRRFSFRMLLLGTLGVSLSMLLSMFPIFGTDGLLLLADLHLKFAIFTAAIALIHLFTMLFGGRKV